MAAAGLAASCCSARKTARAPPIPRYCSSLSWLAFPALARARWKPSSQIFRVTNTCVRKSATPAALPLMTNHRFFAGYFLARPLAAALVLLLALPMMAAQAQSLRPSSGLRLPEPTVGAGVAGRSTMVAPQQADFIVAVVNSEP